MFDAKWFITVVLVLISMMPTYVVSQVQIAARHLYIENLGQIGNQHGKPNHNVRFMIVRPGLNIQLRTNGFSYDSYVVDRCEVSTDSVEYMQRSKRHGRPDEELLYYFNRVDIDLVGANPKPMITATGSSEDYLNYYTHITQQVHGDKGAEFVRGYRTVTYHDVWPGIDMEWFLDDQERPEYQFVVRPGGDVADIRLHYRGADSTALVADALVIHMQHGPIHETLPRSFLQGTGRHIDVRYAQRGKDTYGFSMPLSDMALGDETLVIDPMPRLVWGTYYGGSSGDYCTAVYEFTNGHTLIAGDTRSLESISTDDPFEGAVLNGARDCFLAVFGADNRRRYGAYFGGPNDDILYDMDATSRGVVVTGYTSSKTGIAKDRSFQASFGGGTTDAFLAAFGFNGIRDWATYIGGTDDDKGEAVGVAGEVIVVGGSTMSRSAIAKSGAHQISIGGSMDGFIMMFTLTGSQTYASYYGGTDRDEITDITTTTLGDIYVSGYTESSGSIATGKSHRYKLSGESDGFVAKFNLAGKRQWSTYHGGEGSEFGTYVTCSTSGDVVAATWTASATDGATPGAHQEQSAGSFDVLLAKYLPDGKQEWATYFGGPEADYIGAIATTRNGDFLIGGYGTSSEGIATTGAFQRQHAGSWDGFLAAFSGAGVLKWGTYVGGELYDKVEAVTVSRNGNIMMCGTTTSSPFITTNDAHQQNYKGAYDAYVLRFSEDGATSVQHAEAAPPTMSVKAVRPIPARNELTIEVNLESNATLQMIDALGNIVVTMPIAAGTPEVIIPVAYLIAGRYVVRLVSNNQVTDSDVVTQAVVIMP